MSKLRMSQVADFQVADSRVADVHGHHLQVADSQVPEFANQHVLFLGVSWITNNIELMFPPIVLFSIKILIDRKYY